MEQIAETTLRHRRFFPGWGRLPNWLTNLLNILLALTIIYGIIRLSLELLEMFRKFIYWLFEKRNFYILLVACLVAVLGGLIIAQVNGTPIIENVKQFIIDKINSIRVLIGNNIKG